MEVTELYPAITAAKFALDNLVDKSICSLISENQLDEFSAKLLLSLPGYHPSPLSSDIFCKRFPFYSPELYRVNLKQFEARGFLVRIANDQYYLTDSGSKLIRLMVSTAHSALAGITPQPASVLMDLASRLKEMVDLCLKVSEPPETWCLETVHKLDPGSGASVMVRIGQFLTEIAAYHDDSLLSAWKAYGVSGHAWEIATILWVENKLTIDFLINKLKSRGFTYEQSLEEFAQLAKKGWITQSQAELRITPFGAETRKIAEDTTNRYFFAPFKDMARADMDATIELLIDFRRSIPGVID
jgi:hypothetical protein